MLNLQNRQEKSNSVFHNLFNRSEFQVYASLNLNIEIKLLYINMFFVPCGLLSLFKWRRSLGATYKISLRFVFDLLGEKQCTLLYCSERAPALFSLVWRCLVSVWWRCHVFHATSPARSIVSYGLFNFRPIYRFLVLKGVFFYFLGGPNQKTFLLQNVALDPRIPKIYNTWGLWWIVLELWLVTDTHTHTDTQCHLLSPLALRAGGEKTCFLTVP